jgi:Ca-activated chloride channel family protein
MNGFRKDRMGKVLTTALTIDGEKQLAEVAKAGNGTLVRAEKGTTGIDKIAAELKKQMKSELGEKVETVYADIYFYPLGLAILLLFAEAVIGEVPLRVFARKRPPAQSKAAAKLRRALGKKEASGATR